VVGVGVLVGVGDKALVGVGVVGTPVGATVGWGVEVGTLVGVLVGVRGFKTMVEPEVVTAKNEASEATILVVCALMLIVVVRLFWEVMGVK
jgi:hypothetical protein